MDRKHIKEIVHNLSYPPLSIILGNSLLIAFLTTLVYTNIFRAVSKYILYLVSAYTLLLLLCRLFHHGKGKLLYWAESYNFLYKLLYDCFFRTRVSLYMTSFINIAYAIVQLVSGICYLSFWAITLAVYYLFLAVIRFLLLRYMNKQAAEKVQLVEYRQYQYTGLLLMLMNIALAGIIILVIHDHGDVHYNGIWIYAMATYSFYQIILSIFNMVKFRKYKSPILSASKSVNFIVALVSMFSLEIAMLSQFGMNMTKQQQQAMLTISGAVIWLLAFTVGAYMYGKAFFCLKKLPDSTSLS